MKNNYLIFLLLAICLPLSLSAQNTDTNSFDRVTTFYDLDQNIGIADMNKDNIPDIVGVSNESTDVNIYLGTAEGEFVLTTVLDGSSSVQYTAVDLVDLNEDGYPEIIATGDFSGIIFRSDTEGNYSEFTIDVGAGEKYLSPSFLDLNGDNKIDMIYNRYVQLNNGNGTFTRMDTRIFGNGPIVPLDYNDDSLMDIVVANPGSGFLEFFAGNGDGTFSVSPNLSFEALAARIRIHDFNGDLLDDVIFFDPYTSPSEFIILFNDDTHSFTESDTLTLSHDFYSLIEIADVDLDGNLDLVSSDDINLQYWQINGDGTFGEQKEFQFGLGAPRQFHLTNAYGEDFDDLIIVNGSGFVTIFSDKLNVEINQLFDTLTYTGNVADAFEISPEISNLSIIDQATGEAIKNVGIYTIAFSLEDENYEAHGEFNIVIKKAPLEIIAKDTARIYGEENPEFELVYNGFVNEEGTEVLSSLPVISTTATAASDAGEYEITLGETSAINYDISLKRGTLSIEKAGLTATAEDLFINEGVEIPTLTINYSGFVNGDQVTDLDVQPEASTTATSESPSGEYVIELSGGEDNNYTFELVNGTLIIDLLLSNKEAKFGKAYPNPSKNKQVYIEAVKQIKNINLMNLQGQQIGINYTSNKLSAPSDLKAGVYLINIQYKDLSTQCIKVIFE